MKKTYCEFNTHEDLLVSIDMASIIAVVEGKSENTCVIIVSGQVHFKVQCSKSTVMELIDEIS